MKFQSSELPIGKPQPRRRTSKLAPLVALTVFLTIPLYYPFLRDSTKKLTETSPTFEPLEDSITLTTPAIEAPPTPTHNAVLEPPIITLTPPTEDVQESCSSGQCNIGKEESCSSGQCNVGKGGGDVVVEDTVAVERSTSVPPPAKRQHDRRRKRKRNRRSQGGSLPQESRDSGDQMNENKDSYSSEGNNTVMSKGGDRIMIRSQVVEEEQCDLFSGQWVPNMEGPYYTNDTCNAIQEHQNCLKFGRPDRGFLKWRWKPDDCELAVFEPEQFLQLVRGKSIAFVGDSVARNHMQSLICLLSRVANPLDLSGPVDQNKRYEYKDHDFNISMFWSPYLIKTERTDPDDEKRPFNLYLDEVDQHWTTKIAPFDYVIISAGHWFFRPTYFYLNHRLTGCLYCPESNVNHLTSYFSYRRAFRTALHGILDANFDGVVFLRTFAPSHFEGAAWDRGGDCVRTQPFKRDEVVLEDYSLEMYLIQLEELRIAQKAGRGTGGRFKLFDATGAMLLRPDGHPSKYGHWPVANQTFANDCVHWCLPGPIDSWNDFLQELLRREVGDGR